MYLEEKNGKFLKPTCFIDNITQTESTFFNLAMRRISLQGLRFKPSSITFLLSEYYRIIHLNWHV